MDQVAAFASLQRFLTGEKNEGNGEWAMRCPLPDHPDQKRSASVNFDKRTWYCQKCDKGGSLEKLLAIVASRDEDDRPVRMAKRSQSKPLEPANVNKWHRVLMKDRALIKAFQRKRGLSMETLRNFEIGYDLVVSRYTIPVYNQDGILVNVRRYDPQGDPKMINMTGHGTPTLYPFSQLKQPGPIIICEGELDALLLVQLGFAAITRTSSAETWFEDWSEYFFQRDVYLCHDHDDAGQKANAKVKEALQGYAKSVAVVDLGYPILPKHGKDVTDFLWEERELEGHSVDDFKKRMASASQNRQAVDQIRDVGILDSIDGENYNHLLRLRASIIGRESTTKVIPSRVRIQCGQDWDEEVCATCGMGSAPGGEATIEISKYKRENLDFAFVPRQKVDGILRRQNRIPKDCPKVNITDLAMHTIERAWIREPIDTSPPDEDVALDDEARANTGIRSRRSVYILSNIEPEPSQALRITGRMYQHPQNNDNEFVVLDVEPLDTDIDKFKVTDEVIEQLAPFQQMEGSVEERLTAISDDLAHNVTGIYGRRDMHVLMDLVFHSVLAFRFNGALMDKGWLDVLVAGDTRTGKSETAKMLSRWYRLGQTISCETASIAGVLAGMHQPSGGRWEVSWGAIPTNDRRLVVLDEVTGLSTDQIQLLSDARSTGVAKQTKIDTGDTEAHARTRLIWIANPRQSSIRRGTRMVENIIGNSEDIARFDLAMSVHSNDPGTDAANDPSLRRGHPIFDREAYRNLVMWAWTRKPGDIHWESGAEELVFKMAKRLGATFVGGVPLVQTASVRYKVARLAVAVAARLYSTRNGSDLLVTRQHVQAAVTLMLRVYKNPKFGYYDDCKNVIRRVNSGLAQADATKDWLVQNQLVCTYLRDTVGTPFTPQHMRDATGMAFSQVTTITHELRQRSLIEDAGSGTTAYVSTALLEELLGEVP